jgi:hypothetical protein
MATCPRDARFTPKAGIDCRLRNVGCANSGHWHGSLQRLGSRPQISRSAEVTAGVTLGALKNAKLMAKRDDLELQ